MVGVRALALYEVLVAGDAHLVLCSDAQGFEGGGQRIGGVTHLALEAEAPVEVALDRIGDLQGVVPPLVAHDDGALAALGDEQQRLLEATIIGRKVLDVGKVFAVPIDDRPVQVVLFHPPDETFDAIEVDRG